MGLLASRTARSETMRAVRIRWTLAVPAGLLALLIFYFALRSTTGKTQRDACSVKVTPAV